MQKKTWVICILPSTTLGVVKPIISHFSGRPDWKAIGRETLLPQDSSSLLMTTRTNNRVTCAIAVADVGRVWGLSCVNG